MGERASEPSITTVRSAFIKTFFRKLFQRHQNILKLLIPVQKIKCRVYVYHLTDGSGSGSPFFDGIEMRETAQSKG